MKTDWAKLVKEVMAENQLSERGVTATAGVCRSTFRRFLAGNTIDMHKLEKVLAVLGYELDIVRISAPTVRPTLIKEAPAALKTSRVRIIRPACMEMGY